ncbi:MAG: hypothetical protein KAH57_03945 [Thermoplasmata archaeon]|nr:hypothetical protein [Thermoplasmata archaeon]
MYLIDVLLGKKRFITRRVVKGLYVRGRFEELKACLDDASPSVVPTVLSYLNEYLDRWGVDGHFSREEKERICTLLDSPVYLIRKESAVLLSTLASQEKLDDGARRRICSRVVNMLDSADNCLREPLLHLLEEVTFHGLGDEVLMNGGIETMKDGLKEKEGSGRKFILYSLLHMCDEGLSDRLMRYEVHEDLKPLLEDRDPEICSLARVLYNRITSSSENNGSFMREKGVLGSEPIVGEFRSNLNKVDLGGGGYLAPVGKERSAPIRRHRTRPVADGRANVHRKRSVDLDGDLARERQRVLQMEADSVFTGVQD